MPDGLLSKLGPFKEAVKNVIGTAYVCMIVFGSYDRGDYHNDSDLDILVLVDVEPEKLSSYSNAVYDLAYDYGEELGIEINPVIQSNSVYEYWRRVYPFFMNIEREGVAV